MHEKYYTSECTGSERTRFKRVQVQVQLEVEPARRTQVQVQAQLTHSLTG